MAASGEGLIGFIVVAAAIAAIYGWFSEKSKKLLEDEFNQTLRKQLGEKERKLSDRAQQIGQEAFSMRMALAYEKKQHEQDAASVRTQLALEKQQVEQQLEQKAAEIDRELEKRAEHITALRNEFETGYVRGRKWLAHFISEADRALDDTISSTLRTKKHPALKAAEEIAAALSEKRHFKEKVKLLEYQLKSYKEYFPFLEEYEEIILDEAITLTPNGTNVEALEKTDPVLFYVPKVEYERLSPTDRNQLALDRYLNRPLSQAAIGRFYERYLGYLYEQDGWKVEYQGIVKGYEDLGRDLICEKGNQVLIVQAKCWASDKLIHEKHIFQLFGTTQLYLMNHQQNDRVDSNVSAVFITTTSLSPVAKKATQWLKIQVNEHVTLKKNYPMIKCNINQSSKEKIYHLPFDQQYDRTKIIPKIGEFYAATAAEAEAKGFRRALRHLGNH